jgi:hypothetical protein
MIYFHPYGYIVTRDSSNKIRQCTKAVEGLMCLIKYYSLKVVHTLVTTNDIHTREISLFVKKLIYTIE